MNTQFIEKKFFGRQDTLQLLKRRVLDLKEGYRQNVALVGSRFVGKTSILQKFICELDEEDFVVIYLDLDNKNFNYFFSKFVGCLLYNYSKIQKFPLFNDINLLMENARKYIPQTVEEIKKIQSNLNKEKLQDCYQQLMSLSDIFTTESGKFCVIVLDEFQNLDELGVINPFQELGKKIMTQKRCIYVVGSSYPVLAQKILAEKLSLLFGNFEVLEIGPFDVHSSREFMEYHLNNLKISPELKNFLTDFTAGHPLYLHLIIQEIINLCRIYKQDEIFMPVLSQAVENVLFNQWGVISRHFDIMIQQLCQSKNNQGLAAVLIAVAQGRNKLKEIVDETKIKSTHVLQRLGRLMECGVVVKNGEIFHFNDKLLKFWIKFVFEKRLQSFDLSFSKHMGEFKEELNRALSNFQLISRQNLSSRIVDLLNCFDNEAFQLNGRKYKLPIFREITALKSKESKESSLEILKARSPQGEWFIGLKKDSLCENDVNMFLSELKKLNLKPQRRVIISLSELDENTRIKALQERMWIWNEKEINALLSFYDKPFIVL